MTLNKKIRIDPHGNYSFSDFFKMKIETEDLLDFFGYQFQKDALQLEAMETPDLMEWLQSFDTNFPKISKLVDLTNEQAIREFLISPLLTQIMLTYDIPIKLERNVYYNDILKGNIGYFVGNRKNFILLEAKQDDLHRTFRQLATELIAIDKLWENAPNTHIFGAVSLGILWNFAVLDRENQIITQDTKLYAVPDQLPKIVGIMVKLLQNPN